MTSDHLPTDAAWVSVKRDDLIWRNWDDQEIVVFNRHSGDTHLLSASAFLVLETLFSSHSGLTYADLLSQLQATCDSDSSPDEIAAVATQVLPELCRIGLVSSQSPQS